MAAVTCKDNLFALQKKLENIEKPIGIYILQKRGTISSIKNPEPYRQLLDAEILFKILRKSEYEEILMNYFSQLPTVSEFKYYSECKRLFMKIPIEEAYSEFLKQLKKRTKIVKEEFVRVPYELKFLAYFMNLKNDDYRNLLEFLNEPYGGV